MESIKEQSKVVHVMFALEWNNKVPESERTPCNELCRTLMEKGKFYEEVKYLCCPV